MGQYKTYTDLSASSKLVQLENNIREIKAIQTYMSSDAGLYTSNSITSNSRSYDYGGGYMVYFFGAYYSFVNNTAGKTVIPRIVIDTNNGLITTCDIAGSTDNPNETLFLVKAYSFEESPFTVTAKIIANDVGILTIKQELTDYREFFEY